MRLLSVIFSFGALRAAAATCENEIDYVAVRERLVEKIETARVNYEPFAHVFMENVFPEEVYDCILEHLPTRLGTRKGEVGITEFSTRLETPCLCRIRCIR